MAMEQELGGVLTRRANMKQNIQFYVHLCPIPCPIMSNYFGLKSSFLKTSGDVPMSNYVQFNSRL